MKKVIHMLLLVFPLLAYAQNKLDRIIIPGIRVGAIQAGTSEQDLIRIYGAENVRKDSISLGEGFFEPGTVLFPNSDNEISITWKDKETLTSPEWIYIRKPQTEWQTVDSLSIGTDMRTIEALNRKPFVMLGFGWDYSGTVSHWNEGELENTLNNGFIIRLDYDYSIELSTEDHSAILGDKEIETSNEVLQKLNPTVYEMIVTFE